MRTDAGEMLVQSLKNLALGEMTDELCKSYNVDKSRFRN